MTVRWKGIIFLAVLFAVFFIAAMIFTDPWLEKTIENTASPIVGAKVEIDNLDFSITELRIRWDRLQVANPENTMTNLFETGKTEFDMEFAPLLSGKYIIESVKLTGLRTNTPRKTDGRLEKTPDTEPNFISRTMIDLSKQVSTNVSAEILNTRKKVNVDSILKLLDIQSIDRIQGLYTGMENKYEQYDQILKSNNLIRDAKNVESQLRSIDLKKMKTVADYQQALGTVNSVYGTIDTMENFVKETRNRITNDLAATASEVTSVDDWIKADYERAMAKAKLPQLNVENMGKLLFGEMLVDRFNQYLGYAAAARSYGDKFTGDTPEKKSPPRLKGQDIRFSTLQDRPDFWIKQVELSGQTRDSIDLGGSISNIVSNQKVIGNPTVFNIRGGKKAGINVALEGQFNYLGEIPKESFQLSYAGFSLKNTRLSGSRLLPNTVKKGTGAFLTSLDIEGGGINGSIRFTADHLVFGQDPGKESRNKFEEIIQSIVSGISKIEVTASVKGRQDQISLKIQSNIDKIFADRLKAVVGQEIQAAKARIKNEVDKKVGDAKSRLDQLVSEKEALIKTQLQKYDQAVAGVNELADSKKAEIEQAIAKQKGDLEKKVKDIIKF